MSLITNDNLPDPVNPQGDRSDVERLNWALQAHSKAAYALAHAQDRDSLLKDVCQSIVTQKPYELAWVGFAENNSEKSVRVAVSEGSAKSYTDGIKVSWSENSAFGQGPAGASIRTGKSSIFADCSIHAGFESWRDRAVKFGLKSVVSVPIFDINDQPIGAILIYASEVDAFSESELVLFESLAREIGAGLTGFEKQADLDREIQNREEAQQRLADALRGTVEAVAKTMEFRDPYTSGHQHRVALIATEIAQILSWSKERINGLYLAATVHDIGKIAVPSELLTKPSRLNDLETQMMRTHAQAGFEILKDVKFSLPIAEIIHQHHERMDGSGYPQGLKGDEILPEARVLAVADVFESMCTHRPYRPARGSDAALAEIVANRGTLYDPEVCDALIQLVQEKGYKAPI